MVQSVEHVDIKTTGYDCNDNFGGMTNNNKYCGDYFMVLGNLLSVLQ